MATSSTALRFALSYRSFINTNGGHPISRRPHMGRHVTGFLMLAVLALATTRAQAVLIYATSGNDIARFDSGATGVVTSVPVTGLQAGESLVGIDVRPANQVLYGVGSSSRLYTINPLTGVATQVGTAGAFTLNGTAFAVDFNPVVDRVRVISNTGQNLRINPDGSLSATDTSIAPAGVTITGAAYDRNAPGGGTTTLYGIDSTNGVLTTVGSVNGSPNSPNGGVVGPTVGSLGWVRTSTRASASTSQASPTRTISPQS